MRLTRYGFDVVLKMLLLAGAIIACTSMFVRADAVKYAIIGLAAVLVLLVLNFFRDPDRRTPPGEDIVTSPADGRIIVIREMYEPEYLLQDAVQVSIFMSPLDVHVNRFPVSGKIAYLRHTAGAFAPAFAEKCAETNERMAIGMEVGEGRKILFKQIAGAVARRIVADVVPGQMARIGDRFGMIKFGSRVDVLLPKGTVVRVGLHDRVVAGETILATFAAPEAPATGEVSGKHGSSHSIGMQST